jgi:hypothetical protein
MAVNTSTSPYFDDYSEDKNFHRVLFKPGVAVQGRELTQSQTILQNQIKRVGDYLFTDGTKVTGHNPTVNLDSRTIRLNTVTSQGAALDVGLLLNTYVVGSKSDIIGYVEFVFEKDNPDIGDAPSVVISLKKFNTTNEGMYPEKEILYFYNSYTDALNKTTPNYTAIVANNIVKNAISTTSVFSKTVILKSPSTIVEVGDLLVHPSITKKIYVTKIDSTIQLQISDAPGVVIGEENIQYTKTGTCPTSIVTQDVAYFYKNGFMVRSSLQKVVPDKNTAFPSKLVALITSDQIITSADDSTLLDPAIGSSNYFAPGADRLQINLSITSFGLNADNKADTFEDHIPLLKFNKGDIEAIVEVNTNSALQAQLAERTYDESGNYSVEEFKITPTATLETNPDLSFSVSGGKAYVGGQPVLTVGSTEITTPRPTSTDTVTGLNITTTQGNYIKIKDLVLLLPKPNEITQGEVMLELHNVTNPGSTLQPDPATTKVGTIMYKNIEYDSSIGAGTQFRMFYHSLSPLKEVPSTWTDWATKYRINETDGKYISFMLFDPRTPPAASLSAGTAATLLGNYGPASTPCYILYREPGVDEVAYWYYQWANVDKKDISLTKKRFAEQLLAQTTSSDYARMISSTKSFLEVSNGSPFIDGVADVNKIKGIVGVTNSLTTHLYPSSGYTTPFFYANVSPSGMDTNGKIIIYDKRSADTLIFPIAKKNIKSLTNIRTTYTKTIRNAIFSGGVYTKKLSLPETFALGDGRVQASTARANFIVLVKTGAITGVIDTGVFNFESGYIDISSDSSTATINLGNAGFVGTADIEYVVETDNLPARTKTLYVDQYKSINVTTADSNYSIQLADVNFTGIYNIGTDHTGVKGAWSSTTTYDYNNYVISEGILYKALKPSTGVSVSTTSTWTKVSQLDESNWVLSNGQKDGWYDHAYIKFVGATAALPIKVLVTYDYFTHTGDGPCTVNSYPATYYRKIGTYKSTVDAREYNLRDCLDFRPRRIDNSEYLNFSPAVFPTSAVNTDADVTYYLGRIDRLYISKDSKNFDNPYNKFFIEQGIESNNLTAFDNSDKSKLAIATLLIPPFAKSAEDVIIKYENIRRFTMQEIGVIDTKTRQFDKAIRAHAVDIEVLKSTIRNENNDALLKTGILIENFSDFSKADIMDGYFSCSIQTATGTCAPLFSGCNLNLDVVTSNNIDINRDLITAKYTEEVFASQLDGNALTNPNPGAINDGRGRADLSKQNTYKVNLIQTGLSLLSMYVAGKALYAGATTLWNGGTLVQAYSAASTAATSVFTSISTSAQTAWTYVSDLAGTAQSYISTALGAPAVGADATAIDYFFSAGATDAQAFAAADAAAAAAAESTWLSTAATYAPYVVAAVVIVDALTGGKASEIVSDGVNLVLDTGSSVINGANDTVRKVFGW